VLEVDIGRVYCELRLARDNIHLIIIFKKETENLTKAPGGDRVSTYGNTGMDQMFYL